MNQLENNQQYKIIAKDKNSIQYEIIMSINEKNDSLNLIIEPNENFYHKYKAELNLESLGNIHTLFNVKSIQDAYNEMVNLLEYNKKIKVENEINLEEKMLLIIPYANKFIKFELQKKGLDYKDNMKYFHKIIKDMQNQINALNERIKKLENNVKEYNDKGKLIFDGEYKDGKKYKGKEYNDEGKLIFDGEYKEGKKYKGKEYENGFLTFDGEYDIETGTKLNGQIKNYFYYEGCKRLVFEAEIKEGKLLNKTSYESNGTVYGKIINGDGKGIDIQSYKPRCYDTFKGFNGEFIRCYDTFKGEFKDWKYYTGKILHRSVKRYRNFDNFLEIKKYNYVKFEGEFKNGNYYKGNEYNQNNKLVYEGEYKDGKYYKGKQYIYSGNYLIWEIQYDGENPCSAKQYDEKSRLLFEGTITKEKNFLDGSLFIYNNNDEVEFKGQIIKGQIKKGTQYIKANSQMFINDIEHTQESNEIEIIINQINPEDKIIFEGEIKGTLWWTGKFYLINNSENKALLGEFNEGNGRINKFWDFEEFKGEVRNGIFWRGPYKKYNKKGKIIFDGEYRDGHKYSGKEYNDKGELIFEGEYKNNEKCKGKEYANGKLIFEGEYKNNKKYKGKEYDIYYTKKLIFDGEYKDGTKWNGEIIINNWNCKFEGEIKEGSMWNGKADTEDFEGEIKDGKKWKGYGKGEEKNKIFKEGKVYCYK